jgi:hypothetical protein
VEDSHGSGMDGMGNWVSQDWGSMVGGSVSDWGSIVVRLSGVGHIGNITVIVVGVVGDSLDSAVGKVDRVGPSNNTISVILFLLVEGGTTVVVSNGVGVLVRGGLSEVIGDVSSLDRGVVGWGGLVGDWGDHRSVVGGGSVVRGGVVDSVVDRGVDSVVDRGDNTVTENWGSVVDSVVDWGMDSVVSDNSISSVKSVGGISNNSSVSSEGLALGGGPVLSLVWLAH